MRALPFGLAVLLSLVVLFLPASGVPSSPPGTDKVVHLLLFAVLAVTARTAGWRAAPVLAGLLGYAALSEVVEGMEMAVLAVIEAVPSQDRLWDDAREAGHE